MADKNEEEAVELDPDFSLKEKIGKDINVKEIFTKDVVEESQEVINETAEDFLKWVENDLSAIHDAYEALCKTPDDESCLKAMKKFAFTMKSQAGTFGYDLGSAVAKSLYDFCERVYEPKPDHLLGVEKHVQTLQSIFHTKIAGDGEKIGLELLNALNQLIKKYT